MLFIALLPCLVYKKRHKRTKKPNWLPNDLNRLESLNYTYGKIILILYTFFGGIDIKFIFPQGIDGTLHRCLQTVEDNLQISPDKLIPSKCLQLENSVGQGSNHNSVCWYINNIALLLEQENNRCLSTCHCRRVRYCLQSPYNQLCHQSCNGTSCSQDIKRYYSGPAIAIMGYEIN